VTALAFDTALGACSAAVAVGPEVRAARFERRARGHAERLMPMVETVLAEAGLGYPDLDQIAVTVGPGTFAGLRIGLATARALALAARLPIRGLTTLHALALAAAAGDARPVAVAIDARRDQVYGQVFARHAAPEGEPALWPAAAFAARLPAGPVLVVGSGARKVAAETARGDVDWTVEPLDPDAAILALEAERLGPPPATAPAPGPLYLRPPDARLPPDPRPWSV